MKYVAALTLVFLLLGVCLFRLDEPDRSCRYSTYSKADIVCDDAGACTHILIEEEHAPVP